LLVIRWQLRKRIQSPEQTHGASEIEANTIASVDERWMEWVILSWLVRATPGVWNEVVNEARHPIRQSWLRRVAKLTKLRMEIEWQLHGRQMCVQTTNRRYGISVVALEEPD
jgi:hypothetical protein